MAIAIRDLEARLRGGRGQTRRLGVGQKLRLAADWREVLTAQIRGLQNLHPEAHQLFLNWAAWSRAIEKIPGLTNHLQATGLWDMAARAKWDDWADPIEGSNDTKPEKPERREQEEFDTKSAESVDRLIHGQEFPAIWRKILKHLYFWQTLEYQCPRACKLEDASFLQFLDAMLEHVEAR